MSISQTGEIQIGDELLDYLCDLAVIMGEMQEAYQTAQTAGALMNSAGAIYKGDSLTDMQAFFTSLETHLSRMFMLYEKASEYISNTYKTTYFSQEQLAKWIESQLLEY